MGEAGKSLSHHCGAMYWSFILQNFVQMEIYKKGKVSAKCLIEGPSGKTIKHTNLYNIAHFLEISHSCGRQEIAGITDDVHP